MVMNNSMSSYDDEELCKRLQELIEKPLTIEDDTDFDTDENHFDNNPTTKTSEDIKSIQLSLATYTTAAYTDGEITVNIQTGKGARINEKRFSCFVYTDTYFPMCDSSLLCEFNREGRNRVSITMLSFSVWLPGKYFLLIRDKASDSLIRVDFEADQSLEITQQPLTMCPTCSIEDVLTTCIESYEAGWDTLARTPGTLELKQHALECIQLKIYNEFRKGLNGRDLKNGQNLLIYTTNKDWDANILRAFQTLAIPDCDFSYIDCNTLYNATLQNPYEMMNEKLSGISEQVYCLINPGALLNTGGAIAARQIAEKICSNRKKYRIWMCGGQPEIESVLEAYPSLREFFLSGDILRQQPYSAVEMVHAFMKELDDEHIEPSAPTMDTLAKAIIRHHEQGCFSTWSLSNIHRYIAEEVSPRYRRRAIGDMMSEQATLPRLSMEDIPLEHLPNSASAFEDSIRELNEMVGLDDIKKSITTMANQSRFLMERNKAGFHTSNVAVQHAIFTGNPGTGKTTVARMLGKIFNSIGLLSKGDVICADRARLVGRFIGETEENMKKILEEARGNVLFIDEAYTLYDGSEDRKDFGSKVIDSLLTVLSHPNPDMIIIFAGYEKQMDAMLNANPGLMGRFPYKYRFSDYDGNQLMEIALHLLAKDDYILSDEAQTVLRQKISDTLAQRTKNFSNARWVEQFIRNGVIPAMANRLTLNAEMDFQHILPSDIEEGYKKFNPRMTELKLRRQVGFSS